MTSTAIAGDGRAAIEKKIEVQSPLLIETEGGGRQQWEEAFELQRCISWINQHSFKKTCLQFPDEYLSYAPRILEKLEKVTGHQCFILADSTYGSCCVDEKTAQHVPDADSLIHFGQSCLTSCSKRIPVLYVFTRPSVDVRKMENVFRDNFTAADKVLILFDVVYLFAADELFRSIKTDYTSSILSEVILPGEEAEFKNRKGISKHGRFIPLNTDTDSEDILSHKIFFIGSRALPNLMLALPQNSFKVYDPLILTPSLDSDSISTQTSAINRLIRKRNYYIEKVKDATSVGILVGTLVVQNYLDVIERLKTIFRKVHKKFYVVSIGEINPCKLGNFMDIDCFVFVGCPEVVNYYISDESKGQFFQPILTPYDIELAFCSAEEGSIYGQEYVIDWTFLIEKGPPKVKDVEDDVSLITGGMRSSIIQDPEDKTSANHVVNWLGLNESEESPSSDPHQIHQGRSGIASSYADEPLQS